MGVSSATRPLQTGRSALALAALALAVALSCTASVAHAAPLAGAVSTGDPSSGVRAAEPHAAKERRSHMSSPRQPCGALVPIRTSECPANGNLAQCDRVKPGQLCEGDGECNTDVSLNNCGGWDVYRKNAAAPSGPASKSETTTIITAAATTRIASIARTRAAPMPNLPRSTPCGALVPIRTSECPANGNLAQCDRVKPGQLCEGDGECNTDGRLNNCGVYDVYRKAAATSSAAPRTPSTSAPTAGRAGSGGSGAGGGTCLFTQHSGRDWLLRCVDGSSCNVRSSGWACCARNGGRSQCPRNYPTMCARKTCGGGDHCCSSEATCSTASGPRQCKKPAQATKAAAPGPVSTSAATTAAAASTASIATNTGASQAAATTPQPRTKPVKGRLLPTRRPHTKPAAASTTPRPSQPPRTSRARPLAVSQPAPRRPQGSVAAATGQPTRPAKAPSTPAGQAAGTRPARPTRPKPRCDAGAAYAPVAAGECPWQQGGRGAASYWLYAAMPQCHLVASGELCEADGECGTSPSLDNCAGIWDIYRKVS